MEQPESRNRLTAGKRTPRFHVAAALAEGNSVALPPDTARHIVRVLRLKSGDRVVVFDGKGKEFAAEIVTGRRDQVSCRLLGPTKAVPESRLAISLGMVVLPGDKMDLVVQKTTELGVTNIAPLLARRGKVRPDAERMLRRERHWSRIAVGACEQCGRALVPTVEPVTSLADWATNTTADRKIVLQPGAPIGLTRGMGMPNTVAMLIGPEGGFDDTEIDLVRQQGFVETSLGNRVLRAETAPIAALAIMQYIWGDLDPA